MVQTRRSNRKPKKPIFTTPIKAKKKDDALGKKKKLKNNLDRCKNWILQQKKEKLKVQLDDIGSDESDEEVRDINLAPISEASDNEEGVTHVMFACEWQRCNRMFDKHPDFRSHVLCHLHADNELKCDWDLCDFECDDFVILKRHLGYHVYMTKLKTIGEQLLLKRPMPPCLIPSRSRNIIPNTDARYVCMWQDCSYTFDMVEDYHDHARSHCVHELEINKQGNRNKHVQCKWVSCNKTFNKRQKMTDHMRSHTGERFVACLNCGSTFNSYVKFYDHFRRQALNKSYKCYQCFQSFNTEELLNNHTYAHVNRIKCTECDMTCPSKAALTTHFRYRHLKARPFKCNECEYAAVTKWDLDKHQTRMHANEHPTYICEECEYTCLTMNQMRKHARNEHGDGPNIYCCHCCDRQYKNGSSLSQHLIKQHGFQLPSGHRRFTYQIDINGVYRVQTTRMESLEVSKQIMATPAHDVATNKNATYSLSEFQETPQGIKIAVVETDRRKEVSKNKPTTMTISMPTTKIGKEPNTAVQNPILTSAGTFKKPIVRNDIDSNTFMESLNLKSNHSLSHSESKELKNIDNFSVIKKYAKKKRQKTRCVTYIIDVEEFDEQGNIINTQTLPCDTESEASD